VRGSEGLDRPVIILAPSDQFADANDGMVDVLRKLVADGFADLFVGLAGQPVRGREAAEGRARSPGPLPFMAWR
jgi:hypothetical protein